MKYLKEIIILILLAFGIIMTILYINGLKSERVYSDTALESRLDSIYEQIKGYSRNIDTLKLQKELIQTKYFYETQIIYYLPDSLIVPESYKRAIELLGYE